MNPRKAIAVIAGVAIAASIMLAAPANSVENGNTEVTFVLSNGALSVQVVGSTSGTAATKPLGTVTPDAVLSQISGDLLSTTVTDTRNSLTGYTVSANCDDFSDGGSNTIPKANVTVSIPALNLGDVSVGGSDPLSDPTTFFAPTVGGTACGATAGAIGARATILSSVLTTLGVASPNSTVTYTPHITVTVPAGTPNGTYTSVVTQTAA